MVDDCPIQTWFAQRVLEIRRFIREAKEAATLELLYQVRDDLEASRGRHRERCPNCVGRPTFGDVADDPAEAERLGVDLGDVIHYKTAPPAPSRREAARCHKH
jgi:hypothetical protein